MRHNISSKKSSVGKLKIAAPIKARIRQRQAEKSVHAKISLEAGSGNRDLLSRSFVEKILVGIGRHLKKREAVPGSGSFKPKSKTKVPLIIEGPLKMDSAQILENIVAGQMALARTRDVFINPGVTLDISGKIPLYQADPDHPDRLIRLLNGRTTFGTMVDGKFQAVK